MKVRIAALSEATRLLGFMNQEIEFAGGSVRDLFNAAKTGDGLPVSDVLLQGDKVIPGYFVSVNGIRVCSNGLGLDTPLGDGDVVLTMSIMRIVGGG